MAVNFSVSHFAPRIAGSRIQLTQLTSDIKMCNKLLTDYQHINRCNAMECPDFSCQLKNHCSDVVVAAAFAIEQRLRAHQTAAYWMPPPSRLAKLPWIQQSCSNSTKKRDGSNFPAIHRKKACYCRGRWCRKKAGGSTTCCSCCCHSVGRHRGR